jgi:hypothetical protein
LSRARAAAEQVAAQKAADEAQIRLDAKVVIDCVYITNRTWLEISFTSLLYKDFEGTNPHEYFIYIYIYVSMSIVSMSIYISL